MSLDWNIHLNLDDDQEPDPDDAVKTASNFLVPSKPIATSVHSIRQSVTYRYREFPVPGIFYFFGGIGTGIGTNWYRKKVSEPVSVKFGTDKKSRTGIGKIRYRKKSRNRYRKNLIPELSFVAKI